MMIASMEISAEALDIRIALLCFLRQVSVGGSSGDVWEFVPDDVRDLPVSSGPDGHANISVPYGLRHQRFVFHHDGLCLRLSSGEQI